VASGAEYHGRRKREYMGAHPNICARSEACLSVSSDTSDSEGEDVIISRVGRLKPHSEGFHAPESPLRGWWIIVKHRCK
jgi:hypothetical protein